MKCVCLQLATITAKIPLTWFVWICSLEPGAILRVWSPCRDWRLIGTEVVAAAGADTLGLRTTTEGCCTCCACCICCKCWTCCCCCTGWTCCKERIGSGLISKGSSKVRIEPWVKRTAFPTKTTNQPDLERRHWTDFADFVVWLRCPAKRRWMANQIARHILDSTVVLADLERGGSCFPPCPPKWGESRRVKGLTKLPK